MAVFILTLLFVAAGFAIYQWGGNILLKQATPKGHFQPAGASGGPDYSKLDSWISNPDVLVPGEPARSIEDDPVRWQPAQEVPYDLKLGAATFYIHPTTYLDRDRWNAALQPGGETEARTRLFVRSQASAFYAVGKVWAPRYRQAAFGAFLLRSADAQQALDLAYQDVSAAFDEFVKEAGDGPIILAAHSQGALHLQRLLREKVGGKPIARRIVAAYVVGWPISTKTDLPAMGLPACRTADQSGCILSWMSFGDPANPDLLFHDWEQSKGLTGGERRREDALCVNPISGVLNGAAPAEANPGTLVPNATMTDATLAPHLVGAFCSKGLLIINGAVPPFTPPPLPGNNFHVYDYALFWGAIRADARRRTVAWQR